MTIHETLHLILLPQFVIEAERAHKAPGDGAAVPVHISFLTSHRPPSDPIIQGGLPTTPVILAVPPTKLAVLRGVEVVFWCPGSPTYRHQSRLRLRLRRPGRRLAAASSTSAGKGKSIGTTHHLGLLVTVNLVHDGTDTEFTLGNRTVILQGVTAGKLVTHNLVNVTALTNTVASISADSPARRSGCGHHRRARRQRHHRRQ